MQVKCILTRGNAANTARFIEVSLALFVGNFFFRNLHVLHLYIRHDVNAVFVVHFKHKINIRDSNLLRAYKGNEYIPQNV